MIHVFILFSYFTKHVLIDRIAQPHKTLSYAMPVENYMLNIAQLNENSHLKRLTVYVTAGDLEKSFRCKNIVEITSDVRFPIHM